MPAIHSEAPVLLLATGNDHKRLEMQRMLAGRPIRLMTLRDLPAVGEPTEDGLTFAENADKKALHYAAAHRVLCVADDSGLEVDALDGRPGVHSARYAGVHGDDAANRNKLVAEMADVPDGQRAARFVCAVSVAAADEVLFRTEGSSRGSILREERGHGGFGYDPLFLSDDLGKTFAECSDEEKDRVSHRGRAMVHLLAFLETEGGLS